MNQIKAEVITDSLSPAGTRLTTFVLDFPRIVLAEFNTHRAFSRNSASSRAIPFAKMLDSVKNTPFIPIRFQKEHAGMQGTEYFEGADHDQCVADWLKARDAAVEAAVNFKLPITKQLRNRLLEPFLMHKVILTATDFENFFALRAHEAAEIHIADLAAKMLVAYNASTPEPKTFGQYHIPFGDRFDRDRLESMVVKPAMISESDSQRFLQQMNELRIKISIARCARISYLNFEGKDDYDADIKLFNRLLESGHMSPFEHVASASAYPTYSGNFIGFTQYRKLLPRENREDSRVLKKYVDLFPNP